MLFIPRRWVFTQLRFVPVGLLRSKSFRRRNDTWHFSTVPYRLRCCIGYAASRFIIECVALPLRILHIVGCFFSKFAFSKWASARARGRFNFFFPRLSRFIVGLFRVVRCSRLPVSVWEFETFSAIAWTVLLSLSTLVSSEITPFFSSFTEGRVVYCGRNGAIKERKSISTYSVGQSCVTLASTTCGRLSKSTVRARTHLKHAPPFSVVQSSDAIISFFFFFDVRTHI